MGNSKNIQLDEGLRARQAAGVILCLLALTLFLGPLLLRQNDLSAKRQKAQQESLAYQAFEIRRQAQKALRGPASESSLAGQGQLGIDPQGKPYSYEVLDDHANWLIRVWSPARPELRTEVRISKDQL